MENAARTDQNELMVLIQKEDPDAVARLVKAELPRVYNLCLKLCLHQSDAEDLCQEVFVKAFQAVKKFKGDAAFSTWLHRIAINAWKNRVRYEKRRFFGMHFSLQGPTDAEENESEIELVDKALRPDQRIEELENNHFIMKALDKLNPDDKIVILLKDIENRSYEDIAKTMDLNMGTVKSRLFRAREALRETYRRLGGRYP